MKKVRKQNVEAWFDEGWNACRTAMLNGGKS